MVAIDSNQGGNRSFHQKEFAFARRGTNHPPQLFVASESETHPERSGPIFLPVHKAILRLPVAIGAVIGTLLTATAKPPPAPELECSLPAADGIHLSSDGVVDLAWSSPGDAASFQLEEEVPGSGSFALRYEGPDASSVRSGLGSGVHRFRVRALDEAGAAGDWSAPLAVEVRFMDPRRVRTLLVLGGAVVIATISVIIHGHLTHRKAP